MATDSDLHAALNELMERTPMRGDVERARRRGDQMRRRRRSLLAGCAVSIALVLAGAVAVLGDDEHRSDVIEVVDAPATTALRSPDTVATTAPPATNGAHEAPQLPTGATTGLTIDGDDLWLVSSTAGKTTLQRWDAEGRVMSASIPVPMGSRRVAVGNGYVWVFGGGDGAVPFGGITVIDRGQNREIASYGWDRPLTPYAITFNGVAAWVTDATNDRVLRLQMTAGALRVDQVAVGDQPTDIVTTRDGALWVRESGAGTIIRIDAPHLTVAERQVWGGALLAADGDNVWSTDGARLVLLTPRYLAVGLSVAQGARIDVDARAVAIGDDEVWVATRDGQLRRYSRDALNGAFASTTIDGTTVYDMVVDGQRLLYVTPRTAGVARWMP